MQQQSEIELKPERKSPTASKKNYEFLWRTIFVFISVVSSILITKIYQYQTS